MPTDRLARVLGTRLPRDIHVRAAREVPAGFEPRFEAYRKTYRYSFCIGDSSVLLRRFVTAVRHPLDVDAMTEAARSVVGERDFSAFQNVSKNPPATTVRRLDSCEVHPEGPLVHVVVTGSGFLYNMVRILAGSLAEVGRGAWPGDRLIAAVESRDRSLAGPTAPPEGLCLLAVGYSAAALHADLRFAQFLGPTMTAGTGEGVRGTEDGPVQPTMDAEPPRGK